MGFGWLKKSIRKLQRTETTRAVEHLGRTVGRVGLHTLADILGAVSPRYADERRLLRVATRVTSQNFEDAMTADIFARIGFGNRRFVEIGAGDGHENCTRFLLEHLDFSGVWVERSPAFVERIRKRFKRYIDGGRLTVIEAKVDRDNIGGLIPAQYASVDFLSVDIDMNTSHVWRGMDVTARVACIEYNASFPPSVAFEVEYDPDGTWDHSNIYGASLKTLENIGRDKGMRLVGCDFVGVNAFFVAENEVKDRFRDPFTAENHFEPPRFLKRGHPPRR